MGLASSLMNTLIVLNLPMEQPRCVHSWRTTHGFHSKSEIDFMREFFHTPRTGPDSYHSGTAFSPSGAAALT